MDIPITTPKARYPNVVGCSINNQASDNAPQSQAEKFHESKVLKCGNRRH
jgi:hypothetical protein